MNEFAQIIGPLAKSFFGDPNPAFSSEHEWRYGARGSLAVDLRKGTWFDHEVGEGGGALDLVERETRLIGPDRIDWLKRNGYLPDEARTNGKGAARPSKGPNVVAKYDYTDEDGALLFQVCRLEPKDFRQRHKPRADDPLDKIKGGWVWSVKGVRRAPYRLPDLIKNRDKVVFIVEGEKDVDRLWSIGVPATTNAGGAGKWSDEVSKFFKDGDVVVIPDRDPQKKHPKTGELMFHGDGSPVLPGQDHAQAVAKSLHGIAKRVRVLELWQSWPEMPMKGDVSDWIANGGTAEALSALIEKLPDWSPVQAEPEAETPDAIEITRLAKLKPLEYEREREAAAEKLKVRKPALDKMVQAKRRADAEAAAAATARAAKAARAAQAAPSDTVERLNKVHAVLPIGGKTRVVTFGEMEEFPGRETIVMTQTIDDFKLLQNKYRHSYQDEEGELKSIPLGSYWIRSPERRQYDGGMAFMPPHDGDVGNKLNLWRGFGVKAIKPDGKSAAAGCPKFLNFMRVIICSGNDAHFDFLLKREATIFQKRIRSEIALGLRTKEEGCGKGFYEATIGRLLGTHAMQVSNPKHIIGAFNPHLETLLRLTADEALFVGNHEHRNALFGLITEPTLTIEPKGCGLYKAASFLNLSVTSNADHFLPISGTARRFLTPTVSVARMQDHKYFAELKAELEDGGYEALLYHLLYEVNVADFNVRAVPRTDELIQQRDHSLPPLEAWWCELLETGTLWGADPREPHRAVSNNYQRKEEIETRSRYGDTSTQTRYLNQLGIYDQARRLEPRLRTASDHCLGRHLSKMDCTNEWVLRRRGWMFPSLSKCRAEWVKSYPDWTWRSSGPAEWQAEDTDDVMEMEDNDPS